jgi:hypothetical protein
VSLPKPRKKNPVTAATSPCINLRERLGNRFRISHDPAALTRGERNDPWLMVVPCRFATIFPHGGDLLAVEANNHPRVAQQLAALGLQVWQNGDAEKTLLFGLDRFDEVADVVKPHRRRQWTEEQKQAVAQRLAPHLFRSVVTPRQTAPKTADLACG